ncbi:Membrane protease family protein y2843 [Yersinia phage fHe-Yen9-03]|uniref:Membrane protease family protein y2843 n=1 Tax=Yersinia phage fHe-Yen9-03 TaxID=2052743 RepID=A0A2C9D0H9_9CAUD|nr:Membrane protease family protein y2843 [Yersinia phage fHe-Yen9-03]
MGKFISYGILAIIVFVGLGALFGSWYTVDQQDRGVVLTNGKITSIAEPGLNWKMPFMDSVVQIPVTGQNKSYSNLKAYSRDQQPADMTISVSFSVPAAKVGELYSTFGDIDNLTTRVIDRQVPQAVENVFGQFNAILAVQDRNKLVTNLNIAIKKAMENYPVVIESVQVENLSFSPAYEKSIEERMQAEIAVTKRKQDYEQAKISASITVANAQAEADSQLAKATAGAQATRLQGEADAAAIKAKSEALNNNPQLVQLAAVDKWDGVLPTQMVPSATVPFVNLNK